MQTYPELFKSCNPDWEYAWIVAAAVITAQIVTKQELLIY